MIGRAIAWVFVFIAYVPLLIAYAFDGDEGETGPKYLRRKLGL